MKLTDKPHIVKTNAPQFHVQVRTSQTTNMNVAHVKFNET